MGGQMATTLQNRFETALIAICTKGMKRFTVFAAFFQNVVVKSSVNIVQFVSLLFCLPCFKTAEFFFMCLLAQLPPYIALERR